MSPMTVIGREGNSHSEVAPRSSAGFARAIDALGEVSEGAVEAPSE